MRSIVLTRLGEPAEVLELKTLPEPSPPGSSEVVIPVTKRVIHPAPRPTMLGAI
jgi:NADPH:quinone reductase